MSAHTAMIPYNSYRKLSLTNDYKSIEEFDTVEDQCSVF